jgi:hypothetical protein
MKKMILMGLVVLGFVACNEEEAKVKVQKTSEELKSDLSETQEKVKDVIYDNRVKAIYKAKEAMKAVEVKMEDHIKQAEDLE